MSALEAKDIVLFIIAVFGCLFGIYQFIHKNSKDNTQSARESATQNTLVMNELKHISTNVDEIKVDVKMLNVERSKDREDILILGEHHKSLSDKLNTAFDKLDLLREDSVTRKEFEVLKQDVDDLKR